MSVIDAKHDMIRHIEAGGFGIRAAGCRACDANEAYAPPASDGRGGPHPLLGVPQEALDAATQALQVGLTWESHGLDDDLIESLAHSVLMAGLKAMR